MEKIITMSQADRIKKAEEIYLRRKYNSSIMPVKIEANIKQNKKHKFIKKALIQLFICSCVCFAIYEANISNYSLPDDSIQYIKKTLEYDEDFSKWVNIIRNALYSTIGLSGDKNSNLDTAINTSEKESIQEENIIQNDNQEGNKDENESPGDSDSISKMQEDAKYIKENFSFVKPIEGEISSKFGPRNPTTETVPKYHTGIDIAVPEGTTFVSSMDGIVETVSNQGDYRKSLKNSK